MPDSHSMRESEGDNFETSSNPYDWGDNVDISTFEQILEMDDDEDDREFSKSIVIGFMEQAETTFKNIEKSLKDEDLPTLSALGHFLKGSSATLGLTKVMNSCEKIQHFGQKKDEEGINDEDDEEKCLRRSEETFNVLKKEYLGAVTILKKFYGMYSPESTAEAAPSPQIATSSAPTEELDGKTTLDSDDLPKLTETTALLNAEATHVVEAANSEVCDIFSGDIKKDECSKNAITTTKESLSPQRAESDTSSSSKGIKLGELGNVMAEATKIPAVISTAMMTTSRLTSVN